MTFVCIKEVRGRKSKESLGVGGDIVMKLAYTLQPDKNYKIFANNYFTSLALGKAKLISYVGTMQDNWLKGCTLNFDFDLI